MQEELEFGYLAVCWLQFNSVALGAAIGGLLRTIEALVLRLLVRLNRCWTKEGY